MSFRKEHESKRHRQSAWQKWLPILGLVIIIGFFGSVLWSSGSYSNRAIINQYFQPTQINKSNGDVSTILDNSTITDPNYLEQLYWSAESYYNKGDFPKAIEAYGFVLKNNKNTAYNMENVNFAAAQWNQVLMFLGNEERDKAIEKLAEITISDLPEQYKNDAVILKHKLNSFWYGWAN